MSNQIRATLSEGEKQLEAQLCGLKLEFAALKAALLDRQEERGRIILTVESLREDLMGAKSLSGFDSVDLERRMFGLEQSMVRLENILLEFGRAQSGGGVAPARINPPGSGWFQRLIWSMRRF